MDREILNEVIEAEKEIQQCIEQEQARLRAWLDQVKKEAAEAVARAERNDGAGLQRAADEAKKEAEQRAKEIVAAADAAAARFKDLDEASLAAVVKRRLPRILLD